MHPQKKTILKLCDFKIIPTSNYFISINSNDLYFLQIVKPLTIMEYCRHSPAKVHEINDSGLLPLNKDCRVVTDKISLRPRTNYNYNSKEMIVLSNHTSDTNLKNIFQTRQFTNNFSIPQLNENLLIQDYSADFDKLADQADKLIEKNRIEQKWNEIQTQNRYIEGKSMSFSVYIGLAIVILIATITGYLYFKFFNINTWIKLGRVLSKGNLSQVPKLFVHRVNSNIDMNEENGQPLA